MRQLGKAKHTGLRQEKRMQTPFREAPFRKAGNKADTRQLLLGLCLLSACSFASFASANCDRPSDDKTLFWGDLHVHTSYSLDASVFGTLATPADAYRFAKGEPLTRTDGSTVQLDRPLDFVAVTEHAEWKMYKAHRRLPSALEPTATERGHWPYRVQDYRRRVTVVLVPRP